MHDVSANASAPRAPAAGPEAMIASLSGVIEPVRTGMGYRLGLLAVTAVMLLLPAIYVAMIAAVGYAVCWHLVHDTAVFRETRSIRGALATYLLPAAAGVLLIVFMVKPIFARRAKRPAVFTLSRSEQRHLYTFVDKLCDITGARRPSRIDVDCQVNASASFREGLWGMVSGDLVLTIGLPLAAGMSARQFTGVLAHEFGHFAQGTGMRLTYIVRMINAWFARVVYERDAWDQWLRDIGEGETHWGLVALGWLARLTVWITRRILWLLMVTGHFVSSLMLRQMEFDADRHEARVAGSDQFAQTSERLLMLNVATNAAFNDLGSAWREKRLCDNLPRLIIWRETEMPEDVRLEVRRHTGSRRTGWFDTHPGDAARIASAAREKSPGIFRAAGPATDLFADFEGLSRRVTELFYREQLGQKFSTEQVISTDLLVTQRGQRQEAFGSLGRVFQGLIDPVRPCFPQRDMSVADRDAAAEQMLAARTRLLDAVEAARKAQKQFDDADKILLEGLAAETKWRAKGKGSAPATDRQAEARRSEALQLLNTVIGHGMVRIDLLLALEDAEARKSQAASDGAAYELTADTGNRDQFQNALAVLGAAAAGIEQLRREFVALGAALSLVKQGDNPDSVVNIVLQRGGLVHDRLTAIHRILRMAKYPYAHSDAGATISRYAAEVIPGSREVGQLYQCAESTLDAVYGLYGRMMGDLAQRVEDMEKSLGLDPLPEPPKSQS